MELFPWLKTLYEIWKHVDEDVVYYSSLTGMGELLKTGCTTCLDHHYVFPKDTGMSLLDAQFGAADALGMRFHATRAVSYTHLDVYKRQDMIRAGTRWDLVRSFQFPRCHSSS